MAVDRDVLWLRYAAADEDASGVSRAGDRMRAIADRLEALAAADEPAHLTR